MVDRRDELNSRERYWGNYYKAIENGFNICPFSSKKDTGDKHGGKVLGVKNGKAKFTEEDIINICKYINDGFSNVYIGEKYGVTYKAISDVRTGRTWGHISKHYLPKDMMSKWKKDRKVKWGLDAVA